MGSIGHKKAHDDTNMHLIYPPDYENKKLENLIKQLNCGIIAHSCLFSSYLFFFLYACLLK
jgi:hypothetical protein